MSHQDQLAADGRSLRWQGHRERRRGELVEIARSVIERDGPAATVEQIATAAKVSRQVLYRQFADRSDLDAAIAESVAGQLLDHVASHLHSTSGVEDGVRLALIAYLDWVLAHESLYWFIRARESDTGTSHTVRRVRSSLVDSVAAVVDRELASSGRTSPVPVRDVFAVATVGLADAVVSHWLAGHTDIARDDLVESLVGLISAAAKAVLSS